MRFVTIRRSDAQTTIVNVAQIAYLSQDMYGTAIHFVSGEHIVCPEDIEAITGKLFAADDPENLLIRATVS